MAGVDKGDLRTSYKALLSRTNHYPKASFHTPHYRGIFQQLWKKLMHLVSAMYVYRFLSFFLLCTEKILRMVHLSFSVLFSEFLNPWYSDMLNRVDIE